MDTWPTLDALTPLFAVLAAALALASMASGAGFGAPTEVPWAVELWGARRHPSQVYEFLAALAVLFLLAGPAAHKWLPVRSGSQPGSRFLAFLALSAGARLFLEAFRGDSTLLAGGVRAAQLAAWIVLAVSLYGLWKLRRSPTAQPHPDDEPALSPTGR